MRMFLVVMCDLFLSLYLTQLTNVPPATVLTVGDFYALQTMHETLKADKEKAEESLEEKVRQQQEEKAQLLATQKELEAVVAAQLKTLISEKETLEAQLALENQKVTDMEKALALSDAERERINQDLKAKEEMLTSREQLLTKLNEEIVAKEEARRTMEASYQQDLKSQQEEIDKNRQLVQQREAEAHDAQRLADQMKQEVAQAVKTAEVATTVQAKALQLKEQALREKAVAEAEKRRALAAMEDAAQKKKKAEEKALELAITIQDMKQDGQTAYTTKILPRIQTLTVTYSRNINSERVRYEHTLTLLPVTIDGQVVVVFPSRQIGFMVSSDRAPDDLVLVYKNQKVSQGWINKGDDLIALALPGYAGEAISPYPVETPIDEFMPVLLAVRNNGNVSLLDKIRWIAEDYFMVNRDYLKMDKVNSLKYAVKGFRGTGTHGERLVLGDQLIDLNGRLIGISNNANRVIRINSLRGWDAISFEK